MAVNINTVYKAVLAIANREQRGYITPQEFNILANQAQMDLFEQYFYDISQLQRRKGNSTEHSDMLHILEEKLAPFRINNQSLTAAALYTDTFEVDITGWTNGGNGATTHVLPASTNNYNGGLKLTQTLNANANTADATGVLVGIVAGRKYKVSWTIIDMDEPESYSVVVRNPLNVAEAQSQIFDPSLGSFDFTFVADDTGNFGIRLSNQDTSNAGKYITFGEIKVQEIDNTTLGNGSDEVYRMGNIHWKSTSATYPTRVDEITSHEATIYNSSSLARPTSSNPAYVRSGSNSVTIYPTPSSTDTITHDYIKVPATVEWAYNVVQNKPIFKSSASTDFELHRSEEVNLVNRILVLAGLAIEDPGLFQAAGSEEIKDIQQEKL